MGRWSQYDEDDYRLPDGMKRIGYDAGAQSYRFEDADGSIWTSAPGNRYGTLTQICGPPARTPTPDRRPSAAPGVLDPPPSYDEPPRESTSTEQPPRRRFTNFSQILPETEPVVQNEDWKMLAPFLLFRRTLSKSVKRRATTSGPKKQEPAGDKKPLVSRRGTI